MSVEEDASWRTAYVIASTPAAVVDTVTYIVVTSPVAVVRVAWRQAVYAVSEVVRMVAVEPCRSSMLDVIASARSNPVVIPLHLCSPEG